jgi:hypothetical protein
MSPAKNGSSIGIVMYMKRMELYTYKKRIARDGTGTL